MSVKTTVSTALQVPEQAVHETRPGELLLETTTSALSGFADRVTGDLSGRLLSLFASDERKVSAKYPVTNWFEREVMESDWPDGAWALRKDFPHDAMVPRVQGDFHPFRPVTGEGVFQVPVGPCTQGSSSPATSGLASLASLCCTCSSGSAMSQRDREALRTVAMASRAVPRRIHLG